MDCLRFSGHLEKPKVYGQQEVFLCQRKKRKSYNREFKLYDYNRVFAKILLLEVRNYPGYFNSETYRTVKVYSNMVVELIEEGIENKEFRNDISATLIRQSILGGIEHLCLPSIIFDKKMDVDLLHKEFCSVIFNGIRPKPTYNRKHKESYNENQ